MPVGKSPKGLELGTYAYDRFLSEDNRKPSSVASVTVWADTTAPSEGTRTGQVFAAAIGRARDLANGPGELVTPSFLATTAQEIVDASGDADVSLTVFDRAECEARKMGCYLGVAKGSAEEPRFIHLTYKPKGTSKGRVVLVGKGVTFDSGGYSLKPTDGMLNMKLDMCGSAAVIGAFEGLVALGVSYEVHVLVAATENMIGGHAYRLGDVLTASNGKTVEVNNTDAEGRLTMADALVYGANLEPDIMIDFATLTGACIVALGPYIAGVMTDDERLATDWMSAADRTGEHMWRLPLQAKLKEQLRSKIADMKNTGERWGRRPHGRVVPQRVHRGQALDACRHRRPRDGQQGPRRDDGGRQRVPRANDPRASDGRHPARLDDRGRLPERRKGAVSTRDIAPFSMVDVAMRRARRVLSRRQAPLGLWRAQALGRAASARCRASFAHRTKALCRSAASKGREEPWRSRRANPS